MENILIIEDEEKVAQAIQIALQREGFSSKIETSGIPGFATALVNGYELIILDLMLPGKDGIEILTDLRKAGVQSRIIVLTARDSVEDRVAGLDLGANDYIVKPFAMSELLARVRNQLRSDEAKEEQSTLTLADLSVNLDQRESFRSGTKIELTLREFELLVLLLRQAGKCVSKQTIANRLWNETHHNGTIDNIIDVHIGRLRKKIDKNFPTKLIHTIRGVGFIMKEQD